MITVRFSNGFSIQYNSANFVERHTDFSDIYTGPKDQPQRCWIAQVPHTAVIELVPPCRTYDPVKTGSEDVKALVDQLVREVRSLKRKLGGAK